MEFGKTLKAAREARGKTVDEVARETRLMSQIIIDLENENMSRIAAPIYGRGFVKLYCEVLGLETKPMIEAFMDVYNGNHAPVIRERDNQKPTREEPSLIPAEDASPMDSAEPTTGKPAEEDSLFSLNSESSYPSSAPIKQQTISKYSTPIRENPYSTPAIGIPPAAWRIAAVGIAGIVALWIVIKVICGIFSSVSSSPQPSSSEVKSADNFESGEKIQREEIPVQPLFID